MTLQLFGFTFHLYGVIIGIAIAVGVHLAEYLAQKEKIPESVFWTVMAAMVIGGVVGARLYHVWTDWPLYQDQLLNILQVWRGGLSIIGALIGGVGGAVVSFWLVRQWRWRRQATQVSSLTFAHFLLQMFDMSALVLPITQVIGRWANYVNQELYGGPTQLPWGIFIDPVHRLPGYQNFTRFHPLFAYEAIGMAVCAGFLWWIYQRKVWQIGQGNYSLFYFGWYGILRAGLEFLRIEKTLLWQTQLGLNQVIMFILGVSCMTALVSRLWCGKKSVKKALLLMMGLCVVTVGFSGCQNVQPAQSATNTKVSSVARQYQHLLKAKDHAKVSAQFRSTTTNQVQQLTVEVVNTPTSVEKGLGDRQEVGSDGMLFIFAKKARYGFWMLKMKFDIEVIWLADGKVVGITPIADPPGDNPGPSYYPPEPVEMVLEVPRGMTAKWQLQVGDSFELL